MRTLILTLVVGVMVLLLLFSGGVSVEAVPNTPTPTPIPAYFNITAATMATCTGGGGTVSYIAAVHVPTGIPTIVEWTGTVDGLGDVIDGARTITVNGNVRGSASWLADDAYYFEHANGYRVYIIFNMYRYLSPGIKVLLDTAVVGGECDEHASSIFLIDNSPE